ncbi:D-alanine--D-alanine ligase [Chamaesiphon sp. GL140_3_metabinner_50]|uniref:D-alanine--D-alanine ligase family protein n=1 Tax=Chamaesiphon sp. GL140_3_metabinner_50 TaxID=2970812 RepID=UPI0025CDC5D6|nr:D-alanine--D-alanine ligase [Chamaesiphon sp. GL140_3_metabinner_50]
MSKLKVIHLIGSAASEFYCDLSRLYARDCLENTANPELYEFHIAYITPDRAWRFPTSLSASDIDAAPPLSIAQAIQTLQNLNIDVMLPQMFCVPGMTQYRNLFNLLNIPYVGNTADLMALVADKAKTRSIVAAAGVAIPTGEVLQAGKLPSIDFPLVIKPLDTDNSIGVALVKDATEWDAALQIALTHGDRVLVEKFIELGREVRCGIVERAGELICLPLEEYALDANIRPIRSYADKLKKNAAGDLDFAAKDITKSWIVDPIDPITERVWAMARICHTALGCRHYSLFDFRIDPQGNPWFLEAGLYCSFAKTSVLSEMAKAAGMPLNSFFDDLLHAAIAV